MVYSKVKNYAFYTVAKRVLRYTNISGPNYSAEFSQCGLN